MLIQKHKKNNHSVKGNRFLITINVLGSAGPLRFVVNEEELVAAVIQTALKSYAREGRLPVLGSDLNNFLLYCANAGSDALSPWATIGSGGGRNFMLCKKPQPREPTIPEAEKPPQPGMITTHRKGNGSLRAWINKSLTLKIYSH
ncbi:hypothetical protein NE237_019705 [Protea cynaroides]|uniref:DUF7054 domain-containing protein n=1 Tax=Protea cynaroides TaxID=273540 RepID=A0A9Q0K2S0_9MAGN|nr:hypothetical protein NE237_019705 [Protea cynaroides]